jgi:hypothetical protein
MRYWTISITWWLRPLSWRGATEKNVLTLPLRQSFLSQNVFVELTRDEDDGAHVSHPIELQVKQVTTYRRNVEELPSGMSGELHCIGSVATELRPGDLISG